MPSWTEVLAEISEIGGPNAVNIVRHKYLRELREKTGRNIICYYSGWLQKPQEGRTQITDEDKNGFMNAVHSLQNKDVGLDLILHTPGGDLAATESIVYYLREIFGTNIRAVVPQIAMSAGTMLACSCKSILMGKQSCIGPIDPQIRGIPAKGVKGEFDRAISEAKKSPHSIPIWQSIVGKYNPTFLQECENAIAWSEKAVREWLETGMFTPSKEMNPDECKARAEKVIEALTEQDVTMNHARHIHSKEAKDIGLTVETLEDDQELQDLVLTVHHCYMFILSNTLLYKIIENHHGHALSQQIPAPQPQQITIPIPAQQEKPNSE